MEEMDFKFGNHQDIVVKLGLWVLTLRFSIWVMNNQVVPATFPASVPIVWKYLHFFYYYLPNSNSSYKSLTKIRNVITCNGSIRGGGTSRKNHPVKVAGIQGTRYLLTLHFIQTLSARMWEEQILRKNEPLGGAEDI